jgi:putative transposase
MTDYRRAKFEGGYYFFTVVTYNRLAFLTSDCARSCLRQAIEKAKKQNYFEVIAFCLLPEHLHCVWKLPDGDDDYSIRWSRIKSGFTSLYLKSGGIEGTQNPSRTAKRERGIWQRRFWEHLIRDEKDLQRHVDYIHYNPLKHELVEHVEDWPWSSYHRYVLRNNYPSCSWNEIKAEFEKIDVYE